MKLRKEWHRTVKHWWPFCTFMVVMFGGSYLLTKYGDLDTRGYEQRQRETEEFHKKLKEDLRKSDEDTKKERLKRWPWKKSRERADPSYLKANPKKDKEDNKE